MTYDWKKMEKIYYSPKIKPEIVMVPPMNFFSIRGEGNPNDPFFADYIGVLYSLSYAVKMSPKSGTAPDNYSDYSIYPLEGIWDINDKVGNGTTERLSKDALIFNLMIRQPEFVTADFAAGIIEQVKKKKSLPLLDKVKFESFVDGNCVQMLHIGMYDNEPQSFAGMEAFAESQGLVRRNKTHREIYLSDARKTQPDSLKTILRFQV